MVMLDEFDIRIPPMGVQEIPLGGWLRCEGIVKHQMSPDVTRCHQMSPDGIQWHQMAPNGSKLDWGAP